MLPTVDITSWGGYSGVLCSEVQGHGGVIEAFLGQARPGSQEQITLPFTPKGSLDRLSRHGSRLDLGGGKG